MKYLHASIYWLLVVLLIFLLSGCNPIGDSVDEATSTAADLIDKAIAALDRNSADWQQILTDLVSKLDQSEQDVANDVNAIMQRGIATAGVEFRCNADFVGNRVKEDLQRLSAKLRGKPLIPAKPVVCQIEFSPAQEDEGHINMNNVPDEVLFYGYNFDIASENALNMFLRHSTGEISLKQWVNKPTHYLLTLKTATSDGVPLCDLNDRSIILRYNGEELYSVGVIAKTCPAQPPAPTPFPNKYLPGFPSTDKQYGKFIGGTGNDITYGGPCSDGYVRSNPEFSITASKGGTAFINGWVDPNNAKDCRVSIHYSVKASSPNPNPNWVEVRIGIMQHGEQLPAPPIPPCLCK